MKALQTGVHWTADISYILSHQVYDFVRFNEAHWKSNFFEFLYVQAFAALTLDGLHISLHAKCLEP